MKDLIGFKDIKDNLPELKEEKNKAILFHRTRLGDFFIVDTECNSALYDLWCPQLNGSICLE